jgi:hypothetical protein
VSEEQGAGRTLSENHNSGDTERHTLRLIFKVRMNHPDHERTGVAGSFLVLGGFFVCTILGGYLSFALIPIKGENEL